MRLNWGCQNPWNQVDTKRRIIGLNLVPDSLWSSHLWGKHWSVAVTKITVFYSKSRTAWLNLEGMWFTDEQHDEGKRQTCFISANITDEESLKSLKHTYTLALTSSMHQQKSIYLTHLSLFSQSDHCLKMSSHMPTSKLVNWELYNV